MWVLLKIFLIGISLQTVPAYIEVTDTVEKISCPIRYGSPDHALNCALECSSKCKNAGGIKDRCEKVAPLQSNCCCKFRGPLSSEACKTKCQSTGYQYDPQTHSRCICLCSESYCDEVCNNKQQLGRCVPEDMQVLEKSPCECYCNEDKCRSKYATPFIQTFCKDNKCIRKCNGTESTTPPWCTLNKDKCGCTCEKTKCSNYCKDKKFPFSNCFENKCICKYTKLTDDECQNYCRMRTGRYSKSKPSGDGSCTCEYGYAVCPSSCTRSDTCSINDNCFCKDDKTNTKQKDGMSTCYGKLCWRQFTEDELLFGDGLPNPLDLVYITKKEETEEYMRWVLCRQKYLYSGKTYIGIGQLQKPSDVDIGESFCNLIDPPKFLFYQFSKTATEFMLGKTYEFLKMMKKGSIPKTAFKVMGSYIGRNLKENLFGLIDKDGVMTAGKINASDWANQSPVYPDSFEILVCKN